MDDAPSFEAIAAAIQREFGGEWVAQLDGPDQRYWDLRLGGALVTLHLEHYLGVRVFAGDAAPESAELARRIETFLSALDPPA